MQSLELTKSFGSSGFDVTPREQYRMRIELGPSSADIMPLGPASGRLYKLIRQNILDGRWPAGTRLPPARSLAKDFDVSRDTLRRAIAQLAAAGLIEVRSRSGVYIKSQTRRAAEHRLAAASQVCVGTGLRHVAIEAEAQRWTNQILASAGATLASDRMDMLVLSPMSTESQTAREFFARLDRHRGQIAGVLLLQPFMYHDLRPGLQERGLRCVIVNRPNLSARYNFVTADHLAAGRALGSCLAMMGLRRIGLLGFQSPKWSSSVEFWTGLIEGEIRTLGRQEFVYQSIPCTSSLEADGYSTVLSALRTGPPPQVIVAAGDFQALGAIRACTELGLSVPGDVAVVGTTGLDIGRFSSPQLTVLAQPMNRIGRVAAGMLVRMQRTGQTRLPGRTLKCTLVIRQSLIVPPEVLQQLRTAEDIPVLIG
jgi:DNA-binding LacI/PurR family transcriptional regulator